MEFLKLSDEYKTGISSIDYEHQKLVNLINEIFKAQEQGDAAKLIIEVTLDELINYTVYHFRNEEETMQKLNDPNYESHKALHEMLKSRAIDFRQRFHQDEEIVDELITFLKEWLLKHIKGVDHQYIDLFKANNID